MELQGEARYRLGKDAEGLLYHCLRLLGTIEGDIVRERITYIPPDESIGEAEHLDIGIRIQAELRDALFGGNPELCRNPGIRVHERAGVLQVLGRGTGCLSDEVMLRRKAHHLSRLLVCGGIPVLLLPRLLGLLELYLSQYGGVGW